MAWTPPRTWTDGEVVTVLMMNQQIRDNSLVLKTTRDDLGRISKLDATTLLDLAASGLSGIVKPAGSSTLTGRNRFNVGAGVRFVLPVGADKWTGTKGVDARGAWVEGTAVHHIASDLTTEWEYVGTFVSTPGGGAVVGSAWVEGNDLHYIDEAGSERRCLMGGTTGHSDGAALGGSCWTETYNHWVAEAGTVEQVGHADVSHSDHDDHNDHTDHDDNGAHSDVTNHDDVTGGPHSDHTDHTDFDDLIASEPVHEDYDDHGDHTDHTDHSDYADSGPHSDHDDHSDSTPHSDVPFDNRPVVVP